MKMNHQSDEYFHAQHANGFFSAADESVEHDTPSERRYGEYYFTNDNDRDNDTIHSFYHDESTYQQSFSQASAPIFSQLSQSSNLSVAELSRMDESAQESMLSQSSHHDVEMDRQRKKMDRKRKREDSSVVKKKRPKYHLSERQMKRSSIYSRFRYEKSIDVSQEQDVGNSIEYLVRRKLMEPSEQRRLMKIAKEREAAKEKEDQQDAAWKEADSLLKMEDDTTRKRGVAPPRDNENAVPTASKSKPNWDFLEEGYVTMPRVQAKGLPYYIYNLSKRNLEQRKEGSKIKSMSSNTCWLENDSFDSSEDEAVSVSASRSEEFRPSNSSDERSSLSLQQMNWDSSTHHFPLHFNQLNQKMDLRSFSAMNSCGRNGMTLLHGRISRRFLARLIAGGVTCGMIESCATEGLCDKKQTIDEDLASDMSQSCNSSESDDAANIYGDVDYLSQFNSQTTAGSKSNIGMDENCNLSGIEKRDSRKNLLVELLSLMHTLPTFTYSGRFHIKIATELGRLRQLWEYEFKTYFESYQNPFCDNATVNNSEDKLKALKSLFGVDGDIFPGPYWCSDAAVPTDSMKLYERVKKIRRLLIAPLRDLVSRSTVGGLDEMKMQLPVADITTIADRNPEDVIMGKTDAESIGTKGSEKFKGEITSDSIKMKTEDDANEVVDFQSGVDAAPTNEYMQELSGSLLDTNHIEMSLSDTDYAEVVHEANIDGTNITISLASFLNELTTSKYSVQQQDSLPHFRRGKLQPSATSTTGMWNEAINEYLLMVENESRPSDMNLNKRGGKAPQCITLAQSVMARQSYISNSGGVSRERKEKTKSAKSLAWLGDVEEYDSDNHDEEYNAACAATRENSLHTIQQSAGDIVKSGKEHFMNESLHLFTPIHLATGVAILTEHLTPLSIEVISGPCSVEDPEFHTAFDVIKKALAGLDERRELISNPADEKSRWEARGKVIDEVLVSSWAKAAIIFRRCIIEDPHSIDNWTWYVATLLGIVCVSSGESLSSVGENNDGFINSDDLLHKRERGRYELDHFDEKREYATTAMADFIKVTNRLDCPIFHMSLSSMLEWKQGMSLIADQPSQLGDVHDFSSSEVKRLCTHHVS